MMKLFGYLIIQAVLSSVISFLIFLMKPVSAIYPVLIYVCYPLISAYSAYVIVRKGINPYLAWILPPVSLSAAGFITSMGYSPEFISVLAAAFTSLVGAAAGDVMNKQKKRH